MIRPAVRRFESLWRVRFVTSSLYIQKRKEKVRGILITRTLSVVDHVEVMTHQRSAFWQAKYKSRLKFIF